MAGQLRDTAEASNFIHEFRKDAPCWYIDIDAESIKKGDGGCFRATVISVDEKKAAKGEVDNALELNVLEGPSKGKVKTAAAKKDKVGNMYYQFGALRDETFTKESKPYGVPDMVDLINLNDAELNENLLLRMNADLGYCYCGNTCVALNIQYRWSGYPKELKDAAAESRAAHAAKIEEVKARGTIDAPDAKTTYELKLKGEYPWEHNQGEFDGDKIDFNCPHDNGYDTGLKQGLPADPFSRELMDLYAGGKREENDPHLYALIDDSYQKLFNDSLDGPAGKQAIIITGESGAGKTFNTEKALDFLNVINSKILEASGKATDGPSYTEMIKQTMPIMNALGNATMPRNDDSSRFGKLIKIFFDPRKQYVTGCNIQPYLLEKNRTCEQQSWERNFHIFYQMISTALYAEKNPDGVVEKDIKGTMLRVLDPGPLKLKAAHEFRIINSLYDKKGKGGYKEHEANPSGVPGEQHAIACCEGDGLVAQMQICRRDKDTGQIEKDKNNTRYVSVKDNIAKENKEFWKLSMRWSKMGFPRIPVMNSLRSWRHCYISVKPTSYRQAPAPK